MAGKSKNEDVQKFIEETLEFGGEKGKLLRKMRDLIFKNFPEVNEKFMYGGIMFYIDNPFCGLFVYKKHISLEFSNGAEFTDPDKLLEGNGKFRRHLKVSSPEDIEAKKVSYYVKQAL